MNTFQKKLKAFWDDPINKKITLLAGCAILVVAAGVSMAFAYHAASMPVMEPSSDPVSVSLTVSSSSKSSSSVSQTSSTSLEDSSDSIEEKKEPIPVTLVPSSATQDLNVAVVGPDGKPVKDVPFMLRVSCLEKGSEDYDHIFEVDPRYGSLYINWIATGNYRLELQEIEDYIVPEPTTFKVKEYVVVYEKIEDIKEQIVDAKDVNESKEDANYGGSGNDGAGTSDPPPPSTDTVKFVEPSSKEVDEPVKDANGNVVYTYETGGNGYLLFADGTESAVKPVLQNDVLHHGEKRVFQETITLDPNAVGAVSVNNMSLRWDETETLPAQDNTEGEQPSETSSTETSTPPPETSSQETSTPSTESPGDTGSTGDTGNTDTNTGGSEQPTPPPAEYTVSFIYLDATTATITSVNRMNVQAGTGTTPPVNGENFTHDGKFYEFAGWQGDYTVVTESRSICASYNIYAIQEEPLFNADGTPNGVYRIGPKTQKVIKYTGWQTLNGKRYYYTEDNQPITGWQVIQGNTYIFNSNGELTENCKGIDVSKYQGNIDWNAVRASGVDFAIIRVGYRGYGTGKLVEDSMARKNLAGASAAGLKIGVYVFSQAINQLEAVEEASMALELVKGYNLAYPIFIDSEYSTSAKDGRADDLSAAQRTAICQAFCQTVANSGYRTGVYASKSWFQYQLNVAELEGYHIWVAHYTTATDYNRRYDMWQYSSTGSVPGISGNVDMNFSYLSY